MLPNGPTEENLDRPVTLREFNVLSNVVHDLNNKFELFLKKAEEDRVKDQKEREAERKERKEDRIKDQKERDDERAEKKKVEDEKAKEKKEIEDKQTRMWKELDDGNFVSFISQYLWTHKGGGFLLSNDNNIHIKSE